MPLFAADPAAPCASPCSSSHARLAPLTICLDARRLQRRSRRLAAAPSSHGGPPTAIIYDLHDQLVDYEEAWRWQRQLVQQVADAAGGAGSADGGAGDGSGCVGAVLLLQHPPVYTLGAGATEAHLRFDPAYPPAPLHRVERGGEVTYHGPGQLVMYPVVDLRRSPSMQCDLHWYLRSLEEVVIRALDEVSGLEGERVEGLTGVWVEGAKLAAIGVRASRWVTYHGLALNVAPDLSPFEAIVPCGIADRSVGSVAGALAAAAAWQDPLAAALAAGPAEEAAAAALRQLLGSRPDVAERLAAAGGPVPVAGLGLDLTAVPQGGSLGAPQSAAQQQRAEERQLLLEYSHGLAAAFEEVFGLELRTQGRAELEARLASGTGVAAASQPAPTLLE